MAATPRSQLSSSWQSRSLPRSRSSNPGKGASQQACYTYSALTSCLSTHWYRYDSWWKTMGPDLTSAYATATEKSFWPLVSAHLAAAAPFMEATRHRNRDVDCQAIPVLAHAAKTTDSVESQFATYDYALRLGAGVGATAGVAQAISMHCMDTPGAMQDRTRLRPQSRQRASVANAVGPCTPTKLTIRWPSGTS
jgi:hypothetical protein